MKKRKGRINPKPWAPEELRQRREGDRVTLVPMSDIERLKLIAPPPQSPRGIASSEMWAKLEEELNIEFPSDYKEFCSVYGAGSFADFFGVENPFTVNPRYTPYRKWLGLCTNNMREAKAEYPEDAVPLLVYPEPGGLFPWGYTDNGGTMWWLTKGDCSRWPIVCLDDADSNKYDVFNLAVCRFIEHWLTGKIRVPALTSRDCFQLRQPVFVPD